MGLSNATFGLYGGFAIVTLPQMLAARHVPEQAIASITFWVITPTVWNAFLGPMLDVRFSRRFYATVCCILAGLSLAIAVLNEGNMHLLTGFLIFGELCACLSFAALGGWLSNVVPKEQENTLSAWLTIANIGAAGITAIFGAEMVHHLPLPVAAGLLFLLLVLPTILFLFIPAPGPDRLLAKDSFAQFWSEVFRLLRRREVLLALFLFVAPSASFTLTNILGGLGDEFHTSERMVSLLGGAGGIFAGIAGSLLFPLLARRFALRPLYLAIGIIGSLFTLSLLLLPRTLGTFAAAMLVENAFQALALTGVNAITFETIGEHNPLAATQFALLAAASAAPITYMLKVDGYGYAWHGVPGEFLTDAGCGLVACALLAFVLFTQRRHSNPTA